MSISTHDLFIGEEGDLHRDLGGGESVTLAPAAELGLPVEMVWIMPTFTAAGVLVEELQKVGHRFGSMTDDVADDFSGVLVVTVTTREGMYAGGYGAKGFEELAAKYGGLFDGHGPVVGNDDETPGSEQEDIARAATWLFRQGGPEFITPEKIKDAIDRMNADPGLRELLDWDAEDYAESDEIADAYKAHKVADANSVTVPAGTYFLGDPCYSVPGHEWQDLLKVTNFFEKPAGHLSDGSTQVVAFSTAWGDGVYPDNQGK
jgi:hypothetical protein